MDGAGHQTLASPSSREEMEGRRRPFLGAREDADLSPDGVRMSRLATVSQRIHRPLDTLTAQFTAQLRTPDHLPPPLTLQLTDLQGILRALDLRTVGYATEPGSTERSRAGCSAPERTHGR